MREDWSLVGLLPGWACCNNSVLFMARTGRLVTSLTLYTQKVKNSKVTY